MRKKETLLKEIMAWPVSERANLIDVLLKSLDKPDEKIDRLWKRESENRIDAYEAEKIPSVSVEEVIAKYKTKTE